jgi:hypothetical protein
MGMNVYDVPRFAAINQVQRPRESEFKQIEDFLKTIDGEFKDLDNEETNKTTDKI